MNFYEYDADVYDDSELPVYFSSAVLENDKESAFFHWHEATELLFCTEGSGVAISDTLKIPIRAGELAVINPNRLHTFYAPDFCRYSYFLVSPVLTCARDMPKGEIQPFISDQKAKKQLQGIIRELEEKPPFYRAEVCARLTSLFVYLYRNFSEESPPSGQARAGRRLELVKAALSYIRLHFSEPITIDDICGAVSYSRSQVCHAFKELTGKSPVDYINFVRCSQARVLLNSGQYTISECARQSGFNNLSYFSRVYRKQMGVPPSVHRPPANR